MKLDFVAGLKPLESVVHAVWKEVLSAPQWHTTRHPQ